MQLLPWTYLNWEEALIREFCVFPELRTPVVEVLPEKASVDHGNVRVFLNIFLLGKILLEDPIYRLGWRLGKRKRFLWMRVLCVKEGTPLPLDGLQWT